MRFIKNKKESQLTVFVAELERSGACYLFEGTVESLVRVETAQFHRIRDSLMVRAIVLRPKNKLGVLHTVAGH